MELFFLILITISNTLSVVTPPESALTLAPWITGPSAVGSENGIPSSIRSAPASYIAYTSCSVTSRDGSPQVMNGINAFPFSNISVILLFMDILPSVTCDCCAVFISSSGNGDDHNLVFVHLRRQFSCIGYCMGALNGRNNAFHSA